MISVSFDADETYRLALSAWAKQNGMTMGQAIRKAVDQAYGADIAPFYAFFIELRDEFQKEQLTQCKSTKKGKQS